jgi:hypothetical protein
MPKLSVVLMSGNMLKTVFQDGDEITDATTSLKTCVDYFMRELNIINTKVMSKAYVFMQGNVS